MKKLMFLAVLPLFLSACRQPEPPASVTELSTQEARAALPKGLSLDIPYTVISDEWIESQAERRRKVVIEFEKADASTVGRMITDSMVVARYRLTGTSQARGGERFNFRGDGGVRISILVRPRGAVRLQNSRSTGNIEFGYTEPSESVPSRVDPGSADAHGTTDASGQDAN